MAATERKSTYLGIDVGTTAVKMAVFSGKGDVLASSVFEYTLDCAGERRAELECGAFLAAIKGGLGRLRDGGFDLASIARIGLSCQSETIIFLDRDKKPIRSAIIWLDERATDEAQFLNSCLDDDECFRVSGQPCIQAAWPAAKILWVQRNEPEVWKKTSYICLMEDYLLLMLTGCRATTGAMLSSTTYWDIYRRRYWDKILRILSVDERILPEPLPSGVPVGTLLPELAAELGLSNSVIVCTGGMDNAVGAYGAGCRKTGQLAYSIGSSLSITAVCDKSRAGSPLRVPVHDYVLPDTYILHVFTIGGMCFRWLRDGFFTDLFELERQGGIEAYEQMTRLAAAVPAGCGGLLFLPHMNGSVAPDVNPYASGVFYGVRLEHSRAWFARAVMEAIGFVIRRCVDSFRDAGVDIREVLAFGGGAKSDLWNQIVSDILQMPIRVTDTQHAGCRGAAMLAAEPEVRARMLDGGADSRLFYPNRTLKETYDSSYGRYVKLMSALDVPFRNI